MARDPVCGMNVREDKSNNLRSEYRGQNYFFCSDKCQKEFDRSPSNFAREKENRNQSNENQNVNQDARENINRNERKDDRRPR